MTYEEMIQKAKGLSAIATRLLFLMIANDARSEPRARQVALSMALGVNLEEIDAAFRELSGAGIGELVEEYQ